MDLKKKLGSRKFWALVAVFITSILIIFGVGEADITKVAAIVTSGGAVVTYILAEASIDKESAKNKEE